MEFESSKNIFCTIITANYSHYVLALHDSLLAHEPDTQLAVFISQGNIVKGNVEEFKNRKGIILYDYSELENLNICSQLKSKYSKSYHDAYRWGMKPVFINFLLQDYDKVIYLDSDLYFYNDFKFLFQHLNKSKVLLTPHWRSIDPKLEPTNYKLNFMDGIYNAGFIGASKGAEDALTWWANMILFKCEVNRSNGYYVDQRYLDLMPVLFEGVDILRHRGCNVANWNQVLCERTSGKHNEVLINDKYPIVFIHFTNTMLTGIYYENDILLKPYLIRYRDNLLKYSSVDIIEDFFKNGRFKKSRSEDDFIPTTSSNLQKRSMAFLKKIYKRLRVTGIFCN